MTTRVQIFIAPVCSTDAKLGGKDNSQFQIENMFHCMRSKTTIQENSGAHTTTQHKQTW